MLPVIKLFNRNLYDKLAFFVEVMQHDTIAPRLGKLRLKDYVEPSRKHYSLFTIISQERDLLPEKYLNAGITIKYSAKCLHHILNFILLSAVSD